MKMLMRLKRSLSARLLMVFIATSVLLIALLFMAIAHAFSSQWRANVRPHLEQYLDFISAEIGDPPSAENARALAERLPVNIYIKGPDTDFSTNGESLDVHEESFKPSKHHGRGRFRHREYTEGKIEFGGDEDRTFLRSDVGEYQVFYELVHLHNARQRRNFILPALLCALGILTLCFFVIRRMLRPVRDIRDGVKTMGQGNLAHRVPVRHDNDLGDLAMNINTMASDIEQMLDAKRQLLLGASHELRSPLTRAKIATQLLDESKERTLLEEDLTEMENLITDILEGERMKSGHKSLQLKLVNIEQLVNYVIDETQAGNVSVQCISELPLLNLDETRIRILLRNLIVNAVKHSVNQKAAVVVELEKKESSLDIIVQDSGPGIPPEQIKHVTEPFYRTDASRTRSTGGFGLGLHLALLIAEAHGGSLRIQSVTEETAAAGESTGTRVVVELPTTH